MFLTFSQTFTIQEAFETAAQINKELKRRKFEGPFCIIRSQALIFNFGRWVGSFFEDGTCSRGGANSRIFGIQ